MAVIIFVLADVRVDDRRAGVQPHPGSALVHLPEGKIN